MHRRVPRVKLDVCSVLRFNPPQQRASEGSFCIFLVVEGYLECGVML
jgi:hypothetical protein